MHRWSPTNGLLGGKDDGVTSIYLGPVNHPRRSRVLCIFGNMQINLLTSSFPARHHTLYECSSHFLPATFGDRWSLKARILCLLVSLLSQKACEERKPDPPVLLSPLLFTSRCCAFLSTSTLFALLFGRSVIASTVRIRQPHSSFVACSPAHLGCFEIACS